MRSRRLDFSTVCHELRIQYGVQMHNSAARRRRSWLAVLVLSLSALVAAPQGLALASSGPAPTLTSFSRTSPGTINRGDDVVMDYVATPGDTAISDVTFEWLPPCGGSSFLVDGKTATGPAGSRTTASMRTGTYVLNAIYIHDAAGDLHRNPRRSWPTWLKLVSSSIH